MHSLKAYASEKRVSGRKSRLFLEKGRLSDKISDLNRNIRTVEKYGIEDAEKATKSASAIENSIPYGQLVRRRAELEGKLANLKLTLRDKNPKVIRAKNDIAKLNDEIEKLRVSAASRAKNISDATVSSAKRRKDALVIERQKAEDQIAKYDFRIQAKDSELRQNRVQITTLEVKINTIPSVRVALESIEAQYQSAKTAYDDLQRKKNTSELQVNRESSAQGETIRVVDPANLPKSPVAPKRQLLTAVGGAFGLAIGLFLATVFELPRLFKIQNIKDAKHYSGLPLLASVPPLRTPNENLWNQRSYWIKILVGVAVAIGSIPIIIMVLQVLKVFDRLVS